MNSMKTLKLALIGIQTVVLSFGLTVLVSGCGGDTGTGGGGTVTAEDQVKQTQAAAGAMEAAGKAQKSQAPKAK
jgi:hypothetical protein